jgi:hypothetical protein
MMERISNCPNNRQEIKELISDFQRCIRKSMLVLLYNWEEAHCSYYSGSFIQGAMNKGIYYSLREEHASA